MDLTRIRKAGVAAAYCGAGELTTRMGRLEGVRKKGAIDLVTEADEAAEKAIIDTLHGSFPEHAILSEESGLKTGDGEYCWIIDPLDGTTNFVNGLGINMGKFLPCLHFGAPIIPVCVLLLFFEFRRFPVSYAF